MSTSKELGNEQFKAKNFEKAIEFYSKAIEEDPSDHTVYGNRSASYHNCKKYEQALEDGEKAISIKPDWSKGYQRKAMALHGMGNLEEAYAAYEQGLKIEPTNVQIQNGLQAVQRDQQQEAMNSMGGMGPMGGGMGGMGGMGGGGGGMGGMFGGPEAEAKLKANPRIAKYFEDPRFAATWQMCSQNPQMLMQVIQTDPRFMDVFKELTGIDLMDV